MRRAGRPRQGAGRRELEGYSLARPWSQCEPLARCEARTVMESEMMMRVQAIHSEGERSGRLRSLRESSVAPRK